MLQWVPPSFCFLSLYSSFSFLLSCFLYFPVTKHGASERRGGAASSTSRRRRRPCPHVALALALSTSPSTSINLFLHFPKVALATAASRQQPHVRCVPAYCDLTEWQRKYDVVSHPVARRIKELHVRQWVLPLPRSPAIRDTGSLLVQLYFPSPPARHSSTSSPSSSLGRKMVAPASTSWHQRMPPSGAAAAPPTAAPPACLTLTRWSPFFSPPTAGCRMPSMKRSKKRQKKKKKERKKVGPTKIFLFLTQHLLTCGSHLFLIFKYHLKRHVGVTSTAIAVQTVLDLICTDFKSWETYHIWFCGLWTNFVLCGKLRDLSELPMFFLVMRVRCYLVSPMWPSWT